MIRKYLILKINQRYQYTQRVDAITGG